MTNGYPSDTTLRATSAQHLEELLSRMERVCHRFGLKIKRSKTKVMIIDRARNNSPEEQCDSILNSLGLQFQTVAVASMK